MSSKYILCIWVKYSIRLHLLHKCIYTHAQTCIYAHTHIHDRMHTSKMKKETVHKVGHTKQVKEKAEKNQTKP